jgi:hypothetical protein
MSSAGQQALEAYRRSLETKCDVCSSLGAMPCMGCGNTTCPDKASCHKSHFKAGSKSPAQTPEKSGRRDRGWSRS